jgi:hypothetical protein
LANATKRGEKMLSKERIKKLKEVLTVDCKSTAYIPEFYLHKEVIPQLIITYVIYDKRYNFTLPLYLFENTDNSNTYERAQEELVNEIKRNVRLAHKREELIR